MQEKLDMMKRENGAERMWKSRLLEILSTVTGLLIVVCGESSLCLWSFFSFMLFGISPCFADGQINELLVIRQHAHLISLQQCPGTDWLELFCNHGGMLCWAFVETPCSLSPRLVRSEWASVDAAKRQEREKALTQKLVEWQGLVEKEMTSLNESSPAPRKRARVDEALSDGRTDPAKAPRSGSRTGEALEGPPSRDLGAKTEPKEAASEDSDDDADLFNKRFQRRDPPSRAPSKEDPNENDSQLSGAFGKARSC